MGQKAENLLRNLIGTAVSNGGLAIMETWKCPKCKEPTFHYHPMRESIPCGNCGHRVASGLARYQVMNEVAADNR